jgi:hypothetical protein
MGLSRVVLCSFLALGAFACQSVEPPSGIRSPEVGLVTVTYGFGDDHDEGSWRQLQIAGDHERTVSGGELRIKLVGADAGLLSGPREPREVKALRDVSLSTSVSLAEGERASLGMYCRGAIDWQGSGVLHGGYFFYLDDSGQAFLRKADAGDTADLSRADETVLGRLRPGSNDVRTVCRDENQGVRLQMFLNGLQLLDAFDADGLPAGEVGLHAFSGTGPVTDVRFDDFTINELRPEGAALASDVQASVVDDFSGRESLGFPSVSAETGSAERKNGVWSMSATPAHHIQVLPAEEPKALATKNVVAQVDMFFGTDDSVGAMSCRQRQKFLHGFGGSQGYLFLLRADGWAAIAKQSIDGSIHILKREQVPELLHEGDVNSVTIQCVDEARGGLVSLLMAVNDSIAIESSDAKPLPLGAVGLLVSATNDGDAQISFDNYEVAVLR